MNLARLTHAAQNILADLGFITRIKPKRPAICQHNGKEVLGASLTWCARVCVVYRWPDGFEGYMRPAVEEWPVCDKNGWPLMEDGSQMPIAE